MIKQLVLLKRRDGMSMADFIDYFESQHSKIGEAVMTDAVRYQRRYVTPVANPITGAVAELDFDVIEEIWWKTQEAFDATMARIAEEATYKRIYEDEEKLFSSHEHRVFQVEEHESDLTGYPA